MASITLKDIPRPIHQALKRRAVEHGRSLNREALACLEAAVAPVRVSTDTLLADLRRQRAALPGRLDDRLLAEARGGGRP